MSKVCVKAMFEKLDGKVHIAVDGWTSPNVYSFLGITAHFIRNSRMRSIILDFVKLLQAHTGEYLAEALAACLQEFGLDKKLLGVVCDNADNNRTMCIALGQILPEFRGTLARVRCFAHILNLVVKAILSPFVAKKKKHGRSGQAVGTIEDEELARLLNDTPDPVPMV